MRYTAHACIAAKRRLNANTRITAYVALAVVSTSVGAADFIDTAQVVSSTPVVERVIEPRQERTTVSTPATQPTERGVAAPILGGVADAVIGRQVGGGSGRDLATMLPYDPGRPVRVAVGVIDEQRPIATGSGTLGSNVRDVAPRTPATTPITDQHPTRRGLQLSLLARYVTGNRSQKSRLAARRVGSRVMPFM